MRLTLKTVFAAALLMVAGITNLCAQHYLVFASDRHGRTEAIGNAMSCWSGLPVEYVSEIGDMVGEKSGDAPSYDVSTVWGEVNAVFADLTVDKFSIIWADHDAGYTDNQGLDVMKVPTKNGVNTPGQQIYVSSDGSYYIYAINYYEMETVGTDAPEAFKTWVDGIDKSVPVIVLCHVPMHYVNSSNAKDNLNGTNWCDALNYAATGAVDGTEVIRNVVFFHGHFHTAESVQNGSSFDPAVEHYWVAGDAVDIQGTTSSSYVSKTLRFTYVTAGYSRSKGSDWSTSPNNATLLTIEDDKLTFTKSNSGVTTVLGTVDRVAQEAVTYYDVTFESNGGSAVASQRVKEGNVVTQPTASTREGFVFAGWYSDADLTIEYDFATAVMEPITLYAKWEEDTTIYYTITFESDGGSAVANQTVAEGQTATQPDAPSRDGYTFEGWYTDEALTTEYDFATPVVADLTLYAKWEEKVVTGLTYAYSGTAAEGSAYLIVSNGYALVNNNGSVDAVAVTVDGDNVVIEDESVDESALLWTVGSDGSLQNNGYYVRRASGSSETTLTLNTSTSDKYTNWSYTGEQLTVIGGSGGSTTYYIYYNDGWKTNISTSLTAKLYSKVETPQTVYHTVTFETNGGSEVASIQVEDGKTFATPEPPVREGFIFDGWYADEALTVTYNFIQTVKADLTLYAKWTEITYFTVTFNTNGGSEVASQKIEDGHLATEPIFPTLNGFTFAGWYADEALTEPFDFTKAITADVTVYAKWEAVETACAAPVLEFKCGKVVCTCATEGVTYKYKVELTNTEGECTDGVIQIGPAVNITVVATREGMLDSVPAAIMFSLPLVGDLNGDGAFTIADVTALVDVILGK